jgi:hypothetical protein
MISIYDMYILGSCAVALLGWCLCVWFDKDATKVYSDTKVVRRVKK